MLVVRFRVQCLPDRVDEAQSAFQRVVEASRGLAGVISFDVARDVTDADVFVAVEVFEDRAALERQESLPETREAIGRLEHLVAAEPEAMIFHVSSAEPWAG